MIFCAIWHTILRTVLRLDHHERVKDTWNGQDRVGAVSCVQGVVGNVAVAMSCVQGVVGDVTGAVSSVQGVVGDED